MNSSPDTTRLRAALAHHTGIKRDQSVAIVQRGPGARSIMAGLSEEARPTPHATSERLHGNSESDSSRVGAIPGAVHARRRERLARYAIALELRRGRLGLQLDHDATCATAMFQSCSRNRSDDTIRAEHRNHTGLARPYTGRSPYTDHRHASWAHMSTGTAVSAARDLRHARGSKVRLEPGAEQSRYQRAFNFRPSGRAALLTRSASSGVNQANIWCHDTFKHEGTAALVALSSQTSRTKNDVSERVACACPASAGFPVSCTRVALAIAQPLEASSPHCHDLKQYTPRERHSWETLWRDVGEAGGAPPAQCALGGGRLLNSFGKASLGLLLISFLGWREF